jgi:hypothetical protein
MLAPPPSRPIALTDSEITTIMAAAKPLSTADRDAFLQHVAAALASQPVLGDGVVSRICREVFKQHWRAPELDVRPRGGGEHAR